jgi:hypothetical protein
MAWFYFERMSNLHHFFNGKAPSGVLASFPISLSPKCVHNTSYCASACIIRPRAQVGEAFTPILEGGTFAQSSVRPVFVLLPVTAVAVAMAVAMSFRRHAHVGLVLHNAGPRLHDGLPFHTRRSRLMGISIIASHTVYSIRSQAPCLEQTYSIILVITAFHTIYSLVNTECHFKSVTHALACYGISNFRP